MTKEKPLTLKELAKYNKEVLFPAMEKKFTTKKDLLSLKEDFATKKEIEYLIDIVATKEELIGIEKRLGAKIDNLGKDIKEVKTKLTEAGVL
ncbi:MAG: hypothetical protein AAB925_01825 [Patescibacteria group bacterium]